MKSTTCFVLCGAVAISTTLRVCAQGYIIPNGVFFGGFANGMGYNIEVTQDPGYQNYTGFFLNPVGITPPSIFINTFLFNPIVDEGVRVFLVSANDPIGLEPILANSYPELTYPNSYIFEDMSPFYLGLYTGNQHFHPPDGIYTDPLFGWVRLLNNAGTIELLDSALAYQAGGIYAGTQTLIPEPRSFALVAVGAILLGLNRWRRFLRRGT